MTSPVRAKPFVTPMRRGQLPPSSCRHRQVDGHHRPSGRTASPSGITPSTIMSPTRNHPGSWTEIRLGARAHHTTPRPDQAHAPPNHQAVQPSNPEPHLTSEACTDKEPSSGPRLPGRASRRIQGPRGNVQDPRVCLCSPSLPPLSARPCEATAPTARISRLACRIAWRLACESEGVASRQRARTSRPGHGPGLRGRVQLSAGAGELPGRRDGVCRREEPSSYEAGLRAHGSNQRFHRLLGHAVARALTTAPRLTDLGPAAPEILILQGWRRKGPPGTLSRNYRVVRGV